MKRARLDPLPPLHEGMTRGPSTLREARRYALQYGGHRVILKNTLTGTYMHETQEEWEASKDRRPYIAFIEEVGP